MAQIESFTYDNRLTKAFAFSVILWGVVAFLVGVLIAIQIFFPPLNLGLSFTTFGRLRPLHTNAAIFAFVGNAIFMGIYYSLPRLCKTSIFSKALGWFNFWGWQLVILTGAITLCMGLVTSKEYAELEWPIDILITLVWVAMGINLIGTILKRREKHLYVAIWFYLATFLAVAVLHVFNSLEVPVSFLKSYSLYAGVQDALMQWWYGHNAVAFFLTTSYLGLMYYFLPKAAQRPVYSYKLSIIHFWSLVFIYIWAGPHHLLFSTLPDWAQSLGTVFSIMLIAPSWGGMLNGLLTLRGAWDRVREEATLKFMAVAVTAYGMATLEGPLHSLKSVNAISHFTDWIPAHVHVGTLGWNGFLTFGLLYWLIPRIYNTKIFSQKMANAHFWVASLGIVFWVVPMYFAGFTQGLMWKEFTAEGFLKYPNFLETVLQIVPMYIIRAVGGGLYLIGALMMLYNLIMTIRAGEFVAEEPAQAPAMEKTPSKEGEYWHHILEGKAIIFTVLVFIAIAVGSLIEIVPMFVVKSNVPTIAAVKPYTPLELEGRDLYIREGCVSCHSQLIRPFRSETERYGEYSKSGEYVYHHPFLWGSKRTGPDLHRVGGKYPDAWHYDHMRDPTSTSPGSLMPPFPWLLKDDLDTSLIDAKIRALQTLGVPYPEGYDQKALADLQAQAEQITQSLKESGRENADANKEIIALIAYLQRLGKDIQVESVVEESSK